LVSTVQDWVAALFYRVSYRSNAKTKQYGIEKLLSDTLLTKLASPLKDRKTAVPNFSPVVAVVRR